MAVYVDDAVHPYGRMLMCHCWADSEPELLAMMRDIGVDARWIQRPPKASWLHFDISKGKRALAIRLGAIPTDRYAPLEHVARLQIASGDPGLVKIGEGRLSIIAECRARRAD